VSIVQCWIFSVIFGARRKTHNVFKDKFMKIEESQKLSNYQVSKRWGISSTLSIINPIPMSFWLKNAIAEYVLELLSV